MFVLRIPVTISAIEQIKSKLTEGLPEIKSSHRVEALGRGLGFRTYASLLATSKSSVQPIAGVSGALFRDYLKEHGFEIDPPELYRAAAHVAIRNILDKVPRLHIHGLGFGRPQRNADNSRQTPQQQHAEFVECREECLDRHAIDAFLRPLALLARVKQTKTVRSGTGSYRLKHVDENYVCTYPEGQKLGPDYVTNGMLIAAARLPNQRKLCWIARKYGRNRGAHIVREFDRSRAVDEGVAVAHETRGRGGEADAHLMRRASALASPTELPASTLPALGMTPVRDNIASRRVVFPLWKRPTSAMHRWPISL